MRLPTWKNPNRKRRTDLSYADPNYTKYYDIDFADFEYLVNKLQSGQELTELENDRYGMYILSISLICLEGPKWKNKPHQEKEGIIEQQYFELLNGIRMFNPAKGKLYSYAYRIAYTAAVHYYTSQSDFNRKQKAIDEHCQEEYDFYLDEYSDHKVR